MFNPYAVGDPKVHHWNNLFVEADLPKFDTPVFILVESDVIEDGIIEYYPFVRPAMLIKGSEDPTFSINRWKILDYDPEQEEEYLQQAFTVVAWRYV